MRRIYCWWSIFLLAQEPCRPRAHVLSWRIWAQVLIARRGTIQDLQHPAVREVNALPPTPFCARLSIPSLLTSWGKKSTNFLDSTSKTKREKSVWSKTRFDSCFPVSVSEAETPEAPAVGTAVMSHSACLWTPGSHGCRDASSCHENSCSLQTSLGAPGKERPR